MGGTGNDGKERKQISTTASVIVAVAVGAVMVYLGVSLVLFGLYAFGEGSVAVGVVAILLGSLLVAGPVAVVISQLRALLRGRRSRS